MAEFDKYTKDYHNTVDNVLIKFGAKQENFFFSKAYIINKIIKKQNFKKKISLLDFGCGTGFLHKYLLSNIKNVSVHGIDVSKKSLQIAKKKNSRVLYKYFDGKKIPYKNYKFDIIIASCVFHHINKKMHIKILNEMKKKLNKKGLLLIFEHNPLNPITNFIVKNNPFDLNASLISLSQFNKILLKTGFKNINKSFHMFLPIKLNYIYFFEKIFYWLPLGSQYWIFGKK